MTSVLLKKKNVMWTCPEERLYEETQRVHHVKIAAWNDASTPLISVKPPEFQRRAWN